MGATPIFYQYHKNAESYAYWQILLSESLISRYSVSTLPTQRYFDPLIDTLMDIH